MFLKVAKFVTKISYIIKKLNCCVVLLLYVNIMDDVQKYNNNNNVAKTYSRRICFSALL